MLSDDILIEIFDFYVDEDLDEDWKRERRMDWMTLVHVCRRWRGLVFQSPRRLNLRLVCTPKLPLSDIWPPLPLVVLDTPHDGTTGLNNIVAALEHNDRVSQIKLDCSSFPTLENVANMAAMQKPFLDLTHLWLGTFINDGPTLPDSFSGGSAPRLRSLVLIRIPFPALPNLLLSATHLVQLNLHDIPPSGYIPPEVMATTLSALTSLEKLSLRFLFPRHTAALSPPLPRSILPNLTEIDFKGPSEYSEEILARIDAPRLNKLCIILLNQFIFDTPQVFQFISRRPKLRAPERGLIMLTYGLIAVRFLSQTSGYGVLIDIICQSPLLRQFSSLEKVHTPSLLPLFTLEDLYIHEEALCRLDDVENTVWLRLLHPFVAVRNLYLNEAFLPRLASALQELVGGRTTEVLPTLENISLKGFQSSEPLHEGIKKFVEARRLTSHSVAVSRWDGDLGQEFR